MDIIIKFIYISSLTRHPASFDGVVEMDLAKNLLQYVEDLAHNG